jgi:hypothetical protein
MRLQRAYTVPKAGDLPNEDRFASNEVAHALSDGASISYDSGLWAQIVCDRYVRSPHVIPEWLNGCISEFNAYHDRASLPWHKEAAFDRGSFASLLGVTFADAAIQVEAIGDSIAVLCDGTTRTDSFPYRAPEQFAQAPILLSTDLAKNPFFSNSGLTSEYVCSWPLEGVQSPRLLCMTDALGQWLLASEDADATAQLFSLESDEAFAAFVVTEREAGRLKRDDTTLLVFW